MLYFALLGCVLFCLVFFCDIGFDDDLDKQIIRNDENDIDRTTLRSLVTSPLT